MKDRKIIAAIAGVYTYIQTEESSKIPKKERVNIWGLAGRMEMMGMRRLMQFKIRK